MKTAENMIREMEKSGFLTKKEMTFTEYTDDLIGFQNVAVKMVMGTDYEEGMRVSEALLKLERYARNNNMCADPDIRKGITALKTLNKEIAISMSGKKAENMVARALEFVERPEVRVFRNVFVSDGIEETEIDSIVLTDAGIIILEVKSVKGDVTITEEGRLVHGDDECYEQKPLGEKMDRKRKMLKEYLERKNKENGWNIQIDVDSFIVFSAPKGLYVNVNDRYYKEKYCFRGPLPGKIDHYFGRVFYSKGDMENLNTILGEMEEAKKPFALDVNFDEMRADIAYAVSAMQKDQIFDEQVNNKNTADKTKKENQSKKLREKKSQPRFKVPMLRGAAAIAAGFFAGAIVTGAAVFLFGVSDRKY